MRRAPTVIVPALLLAACGAPDEPGGLTRDERQQLNDAAAMLDANSVALTDDAATDGND